MVWAMFGISMPSFWFGLVLIMLFSLHLRLFPGTGMYSPGGDNQLGDLLHHLVLPAVTLALVPMAVIARITRAQMLEVIRQDFIRTARAKGVSEWRVTMRHAFRNTVVGLTTVLGLQVGFLLAGTVYVETVFSWPGVGSMLVNAILTRDFPLVQGGVMLIATCYVCINLVTDLLYVYLDPRVRLG
jgi:peptide/nickel transport system permease protein